MSLTDIVQDIIDITYKAFSILFTNPHATIKVRLIPPGNTEKETVSCTIVNDSFGDIDVQELRFITVYNRFVTSAIIDAKLPLNIPEDKLIKLSFPLADLKSGLNKSIDDNIDEVEVIDNSGRSFKGRVDKSLTKALAK